MPRQSKGARLWLEPAVYTVDGKVRLHATWVIRDGSRKIRTGCLREDRAGAERKLADYIASKYQVSRDRSRHPAEILVLDVLNIYLADKAKSHARPDETKQRVLTLADFWQPYTLGDVNGQRCREYVAWRTKQTIKCFKPEKTGRAVRHVTEATARRELEDLRSAINHHRTEGLCAEVVSVALPEKPPGRDVWLTRSQAAQVLWAAWRAKQVMRDKATARDVGKHIARFVLVGLYTGTRHAAICGAALRPAIGRGHVDLDRGVFHRRAPGAKETKKRQPPVRISDRLLAHLRRWERLGIATHAVVEWNGKPVRSVRKGFAAAARAAGLPIAGADKITPHALRHTAATWAMQCGADLWQAAGMFGMTVEMLQERYGHHHPDFQRDAANKLAGRGRDLGGQDVDRLTVNKGRQTAPNATKIAEVSRGGG
jgi:integrase